MAREKSSAKILFVNIGVSSAMTLARWSKWGFGKWKDWRGQAPPRSQSGRSAAAVSIAPQAVLPWGTRIRQPCRQFKLIGWRTGISKNCHSLGNSMGQWNCGSKTGPGTSVAWIKMRAGVAAQAGFNSPALAQFRTAARAGTSQKAPQMVPNYLPPALLGSGAVSIGNASVASGSTRGLYPVRVRMLYFFGFLPFTSTVILRQPLFGFGAG